ncbi:hypothetical protein [Vagococcus fluvialis]|uniref:hypothetical protein n=1 Tax=Vagococcus fluvialis TaxID=2738 RepID=UPI001D0B7B21|nr:hypothetical protein [Vagococcus fluvialis]UDM84071.1 hypothetical protein K5K96_15270 [Vagococcus fluvialis]
MKNVVTFYTTEDMQYYKEFRYILSKLEEFRHNRMFRIQKNGIQYFEFSNVYENVDIKYLKELTQAVDSLVLNNNVTESNFNTILNYLTLVFKIQQITLANFHTKLNDIEKIESNFEILFNHDALDNSNFINDMIVTEIDRLENNMLKSLVNVTEDFDIEISETFLTVYADLFSILKFQEYEYNLAKTLGDYALILEKETTK